MQKIQNKSPYSVKVPNYPQFAPWEVREVAEEQAEELLKSEHFVVYSEGKTTQPDEAIEQVATDEEKEEKKTSKSKK